MSLRLARQVHGERTDRPTLVIVPGLFGSGRNWGAIARRLADRGRVVAVDMRNHGDSPWSDEHSYPAMAADLAALAAEMDPPCDLLGHSMGGKAAMVLALTRPEMVRRLVVADIAPVAYGHSQMPLITAMRAVGTDFATRAEADAALRPLVPEDGVRAFLLQSLDLRERRWRLNLDALAGGMEAILSFPDIDGRFAGPVLFLAGALSGYVRPESRARIMTLFPRARIVHVPGAGHWLHAERPREVEAEVRAFLDAETGTG